jgi:hypothetical protein
MPFSFRVKHGNTTWVNEGKLATTVEQINLAHTQVNRFSKRSINAKTKNSGKSLQQNQLESLVMTPLTGCNCAASPPIFQLELNASGCPSPNFQDYGYSVQSWCINYTGGSNYYMTVYYNRCGFKNPQIANSQQCDWSNNFANCPTC